jgi:tRNA(fMet)-specific endonuclease VapC
LTAYLFDTNACSRILANDTVVIDGIREAGEEQFGTSVIVLGELVFMAEKSEFRSLNLVRVRELTADMTLYLLDEETAEIYGTLKALILSRFGPKEKARRRRATTVELGSVRMIFGSPRPHYATT